MIFVQQVEALEPGKDLVLLDAALGCAQMWGQATRHPHVLGVNRVGLASWGLETVI